MPEVSVIIPVYNVEPYLRECLDSVRNQTFANIEVICVDDGSTDSSPGILAEYAASDTRFRVVRQANGGAAAARNAGLAVAQGEYVLFLDSDDFIAPEAIERLSARIRACEADVVISGVIYFDAQDGAETHRWYVAKTESDLCQPFSPDDVGGRLFSAFRRGLWNKFIRRSLIEDNGLRFPPLSCHEDVVFAVQVLVMAKSICVDSGAYYHYRKGRPGALTESADRVARSAVRSWLYTRNLLAERGLLERFGRAFRDVVFRVMLNVVRLLTDARQVKEFGCLLTDEFFPKLGLTVADIDDMSCTEDAKRQFKALLQGDVLQVLVGWLADRRDSVKRSAIRNLRLTDRVGALKADNGILSKKNEKLHGANEKLRGANEKLRGANRQLREANEKLRGASKRLRGANQSLLAEQKVLKATVERLRTRVGEFKEAIVRLRTFNGEMKSANGRLSAQIRLFENESAWQMLKRWVKRALRGKRFPV